FRTSGAWTLLSPATAGQFLETQGSGADPQWANVALAPIADGDVIANVSGGSAAPIATTLSALLDHVLSSTQGAIICRSSGSWLAVGRGASGQVLTGGGSGANPSWAAAASGGGPDVLALDGGFQAGNYYTPFYANLSNVAASANQIYAWPFYCPKACTL